MSGATYLWGMFQVFGGTYLETTRTGDQRFGGANEEYLYNRESQTLNVVVRSTVVAQDGSLTQRTEVVAIENYVPSTQYLGNGWNSAGLGIALWRPADPGSYVQMTTTSFIASGTTSREVHGTANADTIRGAAGNDVLFGGANNDVLVGGAGSDRLFGGVGRDQYQFDAGHGQDSIYEIGTDVDTIRFGSTVPNGSNVSFSRAGDDLVIATSATDAVTVLDWFLGQQHQVEYVDFVATRTSYSAAQINALFGNQLSANSQGDSEYSELSGLDYFLAAEGGFFESTDAVHAHSDTQSWSELTFPDDATLVGSGMEYLDVGMSEPLPTGSEYLARPSYTGEFNPGVSDFALALIGSAPPQGDWLFA